MHILKNGASMNTSSTKTLELQSLIRLWAPPTKYDFEQHDALCYFLTTFVLFMDIMQAKRISKTQR